MNTNLFLALFLFCTGYTVHAEMNLSPAEKLRPSLISLINTESVQSQIAKLGSKNCELGQESDLGLDISYRLILESEKKHYEEISTKQSGENKDRALKNLAEVNDELSQWPPEIAEIYDVTIQCNDQAIYYLKINNVTDKTLQFLEVASIVKAKL